MLTLHFSDVLRQIILFDSFSTSLQFGLLCVHCWFHLFPAVSPRILKLSSSFGRLWEILEGSGRDFWVQLDGGTLNGPHFSFRPSTSRVPSEYLMRIPSFFWRWGNSRVHKTQSERVILSVETAKRQWKIIQISWNHSVMPWLFSLFALVSLFWGHVKRQCLLQQFWTRAINTNFSKFGSSTIKMHKWPVVRG